MSRDAVNVPLVACTLLSVVGRACPFHSIEIQKLVVEQNMTKEQAMQAVRPGRPRVIDDSGQISFEGDL